jgi:hypothetical protein
MLGRSFLRIYAAVYAEMRNLSKTGYKSKDLPFYRKVFEESGYPGKELLDYHPGFCASTPFGYNEICPVGIDFK